MHSAVGCDAVGAVQDAGSRIASAAREAQSNLYIFAEELQKRSESVQNSLDMSGLIWQQW